MAASIKKTVVTNKGSIKVHNSPFLGTFTSGTDVGFVGKIS